MCKLIVTTTNGNQIEVKGEIQKKMDDAIRAAGAVANKSKELAQKLAIVLDLYHQIEWATLLKEGDKKPTFPEVVGQKLPGIKPSMAYKYAQTYIAIGRKYPTIFDALSIGKAIAIVPLENDKKQDVLEFFRELGEKLAAEATEYNSPIELRKLELEEQLEIASNDVVRDSLKSAIAALPPLYEVPEELGEDGYPTADAYTRYGIKCAAKRTDEDFKSIVALYRNGWEKPTPKAPSLDSAKGKAITALENLLTQWQDAPQVVIDALKAIRPASNDGDINE